MKKMVDNFIKMKGKQSIAMLTAYTFPVARCLEQAGIPIILVGDSVGIVEMGFKSTREVTIEHMEYHVAAVRRGAPNTHVIGDMPYESDKTPELALLNARRLIAAGADSVKLEGAKVNIIAHLVDNGVAVIGHSGLTPQTAKNYKKVGLQDEEANRIFEDSKQIQDAGAFMLVLEHIPTELGKNLTEKLNIPTIGIGAGPNCDGQVLVVNDVLGLGDYWPPFSKQYKQLNNEIVDASKRYMNEVETFKFPN